MGQKHKRLTRPREFSTISPARHLQKSSQHERACAEGDGVICSKNRKIVYIMGTAPILEMARAYGLRGGRGEEAGLSVKLYLNSLMYNGNIFGSPSNSKLFGNLLAATFV